jgi:hypothetical protein
MLKVYNPGPCSFILVRKDIGLPDLRIPVGEMRETETCRDLEKMTKIGRLKIQKQETAAPAQKPTQPTTIAPVNPDEMRPSFRTDPEPQPQPQQVFPANGMRMCISTAASTGKPCQNYAVEGSEYCRMHKRQFEKLKG